MKTKAQKKVELDKGQKFLKESRALIFSDFTQVATKDLSRLRRELKKLGGNLLVIKKRLLALLLKEKGIDANLGQFKLPTATIFSKSDIEETSNPVFKFFASLEVPEGKEKDMWTKHILGGYDLNAKAFVEGKQITIFGKLPSREVALAQTLGMIAAPIRSFLYILKQKADASPQAGEAAPAPAGTSPKADEAAAAPADEPKAEAVASEAANPQPETK